jgi:hypothetical protein
MEVKIIFEEEWKKTKEILRAVRIRAGRVSSFATE